MIIEGICGAVKKVAKGNAYGANNGFNRVAAAGQHDNYARFWHWTNQESGNLIGGEPELSQLICISW